MTETAVVTNAAPVSAGAEPRVEDLLVSEGGASEQADSGQPADETAPETAADQTQETAPEIEEAFDESTLYGDVQTDFSDAAYEKAAAHWSKQFGGKPLDLSDPIHRGMLKEIMSRGRDFSALKQQMDSVPADDESTDDAAPSDEAVPEQPQAPTTEQIQKFVEGVNKVAETMIRPEITIPWVEQHLEQLIGSKAAAALPKEAKVAFAKNAISGQLMILNEVLPKILDNLIPTLFKKQLGSDYPLLSDMHSSQLESRAFTDLSSEKNKAGQPLYTDLQKMKDNGALDTVFKDFPWLKDGEFKDAKGKPLSTLENRKYILRNAWKIAFNAERGKATSPEMLAQIAQKGKEQAGRAADVAAASRLAAGESKGGFTPKPSDLLSEMTKWQEGTPEYKAGKAMQRPANFPDPRARR